MSTSCVVACFLAHRYDLKKGSFTPFSQASMCLKVANLTFVCLFAFWRTPSSLLQLASTSPSLVTSGSTQPSAMVSSFGPLPLQRAGLLLCYSYYTRLPPNRPQLVSLQQSKLHWVPALLAAVVGLCDLIIAFLPSPTASYAMVDQYLIIIQALIFEVSLSVVSAYHCSAKVVAGACLGLLVDCPDVPH